MNDLFYKNENINLIIKNFIDKKLRGFEEIKYAYAVMNKKNPTDITIITNKDDWFEHYTKNKYQLSDPVLITATNRIIPFSWDENIMINSGLRLPKIFNMAKDYNIISGYSFIVHDHKNNVGVLSLMTDEYCKNDVEVKIESHKDQLQMLLLTVHDKLISLYSEMSLSDDKNKKAVFSKRENEVLYFASLGKTYNEIATILDIKLSTVKFHTGNALKKLGVSNIRQGIRIATELQLIYPIIL
ncbi:LuxR family transcriptional regulator [Rouxiella sp. S1S-2]|uniref:LuxR family transcriptional regulator n=1 Tax=Rouxiella sp. S1S-2 TaxID=2653856 RepID=UPI001265659D|nr:LuxR family transcriptional regulator [Rouxiella sp. S1S-2]KAB7894764.1 LuxR family transcriptional regulator [Rouxiella sp. S1S-2]